MTTVGLMKSEFERQSTRKPLAGSTDPRGEILLLGAQNEEAA